MSKRGSSQTTGNEAGNKKFRKSSAVTTPAVHKRGVRSEADTAAAAKKAHRCDTYQKYAPSLNLL